ncbi:MAG TPA: rod shape-determining protein MreC [Solirubrobacterales bacterium]
MYRKQVRRRRAVLALLIIGSFVLLTLTYGHKSGGLQRGVSTIFSPLQNVSDRALKPARDLVNWFDKTFDARGENGKLKTELAKARTEAVNSDVAISENAQLRKLLSLDREVVPSGYQEVTARVISRSPTVWQSSVTIGAGSGDGVSVDDPVISGDGLVGQVSAVTGGSAQVTLLTDHTSAVSAKVVPQGVQGVVKPEIGNPEDLTLAFIDSTRRVHRGESVVTAGWRSQGLSSLYPPNLPVGEVTHASILEQEAIQQVELRPFADLADLDLLQVLTGGSRG